MKKQTKTCSKCGYIYGGSLALHECTGTATWGQIEVTPGAILYHQMYVKSMLLRIYWMLVIIAVVLIVGLFI